MSTANEGDYPVIPQIQEKATQLFDSYQQRHSRVLSVREDIRYPADYGPVYDNEDIAKTMAKVAQTFKRKGLDPAYIWVRAEKSSEHPHYHCLVLLDGQKTRSAGMVYDVTERHWQNTIGASAVGLIERCNGDREHPHENGEVIPRSVGRPDYVNRQISYIAKTKEKSPRKDGLRDFGMSRLKKNPTTQNSN
ncbi:MAG: inovirus Gp2 family protein [Desulfovibrio sp.]|uniref:YagK/YfjJ domain-containing protein n=1 Tax=Desulfovibrio sp. TaxID=885 RepID=UPI001A7D5100|nr:inovirus-type Gp2 protein [Desulfovibrio sp.]MBD5416543.1 inovirus Gp2 family protein [Desulfovibrio sp.]